MVKPHEMGPELYKKIYYKYDNDWGAAVVGVIGGQGSAKTACCLDLAEKKLRWHPQEKIFWHDTIGSPCQYRKAKYYPYKIFVEEGLHIEFYNITKKHLEHPDITVFTDIEQLYQHAEYQTINVVYFRSRKSWVGFKEKPNINNGDQYGLMQYLMSGNHAANNWQTIIVDEMESLFPPDVTNQTDEKWWNWTTRISSNLVKECRKCRVGLIGNYHKHSSIHHKISEKIMFHIWGLGSTPKYTRIKQGMIDGCNLGEFCIDHDGAKFGKIKIKTIYYPPAEEWVARYC